MNYKLKIQRLQQRLNGHSWHDRIIMACIRRLREHQELSVKKEAV